MSRNEQDNIDHLDLPDPIQTEAIYFTTTGEAISREAYNQMKQPPKICAKKVMHNETGKVTLFVLCDSGAQMFDPRETDVRYLRRNVWKFRRVSGTSFDLYMKFLKQKYTSLLQQAQRRL
jgi:hypothetical protein